MGQKSYIFPWITGQVALLLKAVFLQLELLLARLRYVLLKQKTI